MLHESVRAWANDFVTLGCGVVEAINNSPNKDETSTKRSTKQQIRSNLNPATSNNDRKATKNTNPVRKLTYSNEQTWAERKLRSVQQISSPSSWLLFTSLKRKPQLWFTIKPTVKDLNCFKIWLNLCNGSAATVHLHRHIKNPSAWRNRNWWFKTGVSGGSAETPLALFGE